jgi:hypothetical protein
VKVPLVYPKIPSPANCPLKQCIAFEKLDGTNISFYWDADHMYHAFGTRRDKFIMPTKYKSSSQGIEDFRSKHPGLDVDPLKFDSNLELDQILRDNFYNSQVIVFAEFLGKNSFAGQHDPLDEKQFIIIDILVDGAMIVPEEFISLFGKFNIPKVIYKGKYTGQFVEDVRNGKYKVNEGVVVKGVVKGKVYMTKIKTNAYLEKLKNKFQDNWKDYWE